MKRSICFFLLAALILGLAGCGSQVRIDYGTSSLYTKADMDAAIQVIRQRFDAWEEGCELHSIRYVSDENSNEENLNWMNELGAAQGIEQSFTQCILFESSFHSPRRNAGAWNPNQEYTGWGWWLARTEDGPWQLMTCGYG